MIVRRALLALPLALVALPSVASAGDGQIYYPPPRPRNPDATVAAEIRFGPYRPEVDREFGGDGPYREVFGDDTRFMLGLEVDWQAIHIPHVGSIALGGLAGYTRASAWAKNTGTSQLSGERTTFDMWLLAALAVVRIDVLARETWIPIVPYGKVGPAVGLWSAGTAHGTAQSPDGKIGAGRTHGLFYAIGGMLLLDVFDRTTAKTADVELGIKHTYVFGEYTIASLRGLGQTNVMQVGDQTWTLGLAFEL